MNNTALVLSGRVPGERIGPWTILSGKKLSSRRLTQGAKGRTPGVPPIIRVTEIAGLFRLGRRGLPRIGFELIAKAIPRSGYGATPQRQLSLPAFFCQISCAILSWFAQPSCVTLNSAVYSSYNPLTGIPVRKINNN
ncbi:hypothetical protein [Thalassolituus alkanivorans]|uniref:hypothetical protein n=1 Tax=Thalassolituus alkanivorans TaxID=2881055 RepID=UPI001E618A35|nr:hypothetical protein [Thalassolituus alkanivorans]MCB2387981.1 hypothetical protein [Thalassolituus alkanivorans]MCB2423574.1 hypothetical protein [Thalassolituus alkanivorans]